jgi:hypothetical protein
MVDLNLLNQGVRSVQFMTPKVGMTPGAMGGATPEDNSPEAAARRSQMTENLFATQYGEDPTESSIVRVGKFLAAAGVDMADMVTSAVTPMQRGDVWAGARGMGAAELADFAKRNKSGVELTSGLVAAVATAGLAEAYLVPALGARLASSTALSNTRLWKMGEQMLGGARVKAVDSAMTAAVNGELMSVLGTAGGKALLRTRVAQGIGSGVVQEAAVAAVTHTNSELWSDDTSTNLAMLALGVGITGGLGALGARYEVRQIANSEEVMGARAAASDPHGFAAIRAFAPDADEIATLADKAEYKESANLTGLLMSARQIAPEGLPANRKALIDAEAKQAEIQARQSLQKITTKGIAGVPNSSFSVSDSRNAAAGRHLTEAGHADPTVFLGIDSLGLADVTRVQADRAAHIKTLMDSESVEMKRLGRKLSEQEGLGLVNGTWMPLSRELEEFSKFEPGRVKLNPVKGGGGFDYRVDLSSGKRISINEGASIKDFGKMSFVDQLQIYEGLNQVGSRMRANKQVFTLPKNPSWLQIDFGLEYQKKGGQVDFTSLAGITDTDSAIVRSLRLKADEALAIQQTKGTLTFWDRAKLNLPLPGSLERLHDGAGESMIRVLNTVRKEQKITAAELKEIRKQLLDMSDLRQGVKTKDPEILGDMFNFNRSVETGEWRPVIVGFADLSRVQPELHGTRDHLVIASAENKIFRHEQLRKGFVTRELVDTLDQLPEYRESMDILGFARDQVTGAGGAFDQGVGTALTRGHRYRDSKKMLGALRTREVIDRIAEESTNNLLTRVFSGAQNRLATVANRGSKTLVDQWYSMAGGWDLKRGTVQLDGGYAGFELLPTARNAKRLGREVQEGELLVNKATGSPVVLDQVGLDYVERFQIAARSLLKDTNAVRMSRGLSPLETKEWYVPPPNTKGKIIGFTIDRTGKTVPGGAIIANNQAEFDELRRVKIQQLEAEGEGHRFYSQSEIEATDDLWDLAEMNWVDPGFVGAKKAGQSGSIFGDRVNNNALEESLEWVQDKVKAVVNGTVRSLYDSQLAIARARSAAENAVGGAERRTIWDEWEATILGKPLTSVKPGQGTKAVRAAESLTQSLIDSGWPLAKAIGSTQLSKWVEDLTHKLGMSRVKGFKTFDELAEQLGPYTPYKSAMDFAEANLRVSVPPEVKDLSNGINRLTANLLLRWLEIPNAAMNLVGIVTNMPSILRSPNTPIMASIGLTNGSKVGVVDSYRILAGGFKDMLNATRHADWDVMVKNGDTTQSIAELNKQLSLIDSKSTFMRVMSGDKSRQIKPGKMPKSAKEFKDWAANKGVSGLAAMAADTSESMSRTWAHFVGLRLADLNGIAGTEARHSFARNVANQAIANYNPMNRPELFQTSFGSMFGLFTSWVQQYNQRLFRWMETGDYASVGRQLAMQSAFFGVASMPGYNAIETLMQEIGIGPNGNPEATLTDAIYAKYGPTVGAIVANGGFQEITKVLGGEGVAIYTRGDMNFRTPSIDPTQLMAGLSMIKNISTGIVDTAGAIISKAKDGEESQVTARYITEIMARAMPNRAMKGAITVLANGGQDISASGEIIAETQTMFETGLRLMGLRSSRQQGEIDAYYANTTMRRRQAGRMETLREETRALIRSGEPYEPMQIFNKYVERGGSPAHFKRWIEEQIKATQTSRGARELVKSLKSENSQLEAWRYEMR